MTLPSTNNLKDATGMNRSVDHRPASSAILTPPVVSSSGWCLAAQLGANGGFCFACPKEAEMGYRLDFSDQVRLGMAEYEDEPEYFDPLWHRRCLKCGQLLKKGADRIETTPAYTDISEDGIPMPIPAITWRIVDCPKCGQQSEPLD